ncbi:MAG: prepilin peptidase [Candidatus Hadarchaeota archaeon]
MTNPELILVAIALGGTCVAIYTDLKERIIPNRMTFPLIAFGIFSWLIVGIFRGDLWTATSGALGAALSFAIGYAMWLTGGWAGGDVKLFTAYGALLPFYRPPSQIPPYPFPITILFNSVISIIPAMLVYAAVQRARGQGILYERVKITELKEGMIPAELIYEKGGKIIRGVSRLGLKPRGIRVLADPNRAAGFTRQQAGALKRLVRNKRLENTIKLKRGMPYAPALGAGIFIGVFYGDIYLKILSAVTGTA